MKLFNRRLVLISVITCATLFGTSISTFAASELTLTKDIEVNDINEIKLDAHVGTVKLSKSQDNFIHIYVKVSESDEWSLFKSSPDEAELAIKNDGKRIEVSLNNDEYNEEWQIEIPSSVHVDADLGVGEMIIEGISSNLSADVGVGEIQIDGTANNYRAVTAQAGVGDAVIKSDAGQQEEVRALVSKQVSWSGEGSSTMDVEVGVGEASIKLN